MEGMADQIRHRGPDDGRHWIGAGVGLAFRRLAIIDVATGAQPMANEDGSIQLVFNGEIYNHRELRAELEAAGHRFATRGSDTEVLVHGYEQWGPRGLCERLRGMFAFAVWDAAARRLVLGRDRAGKKPLFYAHREDRAIGFASELKALSPLDYWSRELDHEALHHYLSLQYVPAPFTIRKGARKLPPAHFALWDQRSGRITIERYWRLNYEPKALLSMREAMAECEALIDEAVRIRLESEVPLGCFLSGGIDSSAVVAFMRRHVPGRLRTFSIGFDEAKFNELPHARLIAKRFATDHHEEIVRPDAAAILPRLAWHFDEPFADPSAVPTYYVSLLARRHVTVALNGDGGDESFAGYPRYRGFHPLPAWNRVPRWMRAGVAAPAFDILARLFPGVPQLALARYVNRLGLMPAERNYAEAMVYCRDDQKRALYTPALRRELAGNSSLRRITLRAMATASARERLDRYLASDVETYLPGALLPKVDRTTMACGVEGRSPFLDHRLMEFAARLPVGFKLPDGELKGFLKRVLGRHLPAEILHRPKAGFAVPTAAWLRGPLRGMLHDTLLDRTARQRGVFHPAAVRRLVDDHLSGRTDEKRPLWALMMFELWAREFGG